MAIWSTSYENQPRNFNNPGEGAYHFRDFKTAVRERISVEHIMGDDEQDLTDSVGGEHKEGSARALVTDEGSALRPTAERFTSTEKIGRMEVDMTILDTLRTQDGDDLQNVAGYDYTDQLAKKIAVSCATILGSSGVPTAPTDPTETELYTIFDYDKIVDIIQDQVVNGIKKYTLSPQVPNIAAAGSETVLKGWETFLETAEVAEKLASVNVDEAYATSLDGKTHNIFDADNVDNEDNIQADSDSPSANSSVVLESIHARDIYGTVIKGAVYA